MLPMTVLKNAISKPIMIELKSGEAYNGILDSADYYMNMKLTEVTITSPDGSKFYHISECYIRGNCIKFYKISDDVISTAS